MNDHFKRSKVYQIFSLFRQLGFHSGTLTIESYFGRVPSAFAMDDVDCRSYTVNTIQECSYTDEYNENCGQNEGAGVECHDDDPSPAGKK